MMLMSEVAPVVFKATNPDPFAVTFCVTVSGPADTSVMSLLFALVTIPLRFARPSRPVAVPTASAPAV